MKSNFILQAMKSTCLLCVVSLIHGCGSTQNLSEKQSDNAAQYNSQLGAQYLQRGELDQAREKLLKALEQDDSNALAHVAYAQLQARVSEPDSAFVHFKRALELEPDQADHRNSYGIFLCQQEKYEEASKQFRVAANNAYYRTPEFALDNAGICMLDADASSRQTGNTAEAERFLNKAESFLREALRVNPQFANAYLHMADLMHRRQRLTVADAYYQRFTAYGRESSESLWLGLKIKRDAGQLKTAEQYASRLLNQFPSSDEAGEYLARPIR